MASALLYDLREIQGVDLKEASSWPHICEGLTYAICHAIYVTCASVFLQLARPCLLCLLDAVLCLFGASG